MQKNNTIGIIVLGGHIQGLGIVRIFGRKGIPVIVIDNTSFNLAKRSKYCSSFYKINDNNLLGFFTLPEIEEKYKSWVIFPTNDLHVKMLSQNKELLENNFIVSTDSWNKVNLFYNKKETYKLAKKIKIPIAKTFFPNNENDIEKLGIEYPCIIKPAIAYNFYKQIKKKVFVCKNLINLKKNYHKALKIIPAEEIIVQEVIKGPSKNQFSACFLFLNGQTYVHLAACRMRQHPLDFGNATTYAETVNLPELKEYGERILKAASYNGVCEVEFKLDDKDKQYKFLEVNARTWKWHTIANKADTPFLALFFDYLTGGKIQPVNRLTHASFFHFLTDFPIQIKLLLKGYRYWNRKLKPIESAVWALDDKIPWFYEKLYLLYFIFKR